MKLLAWDTSAKAGAIAALEWSAEAKDPRSTIVVRSELHLNVDSAHSDQLLWGIDSVLRSAQWKLQDLDSLAVGIGPGSFTGLRIGVTTARTMGHQLKIPVVPVSSLAAMIRPIALSLSEIDPKSFVIASIGACKGELYVLDGLSKSLLDCVVPALGDAPGLWKRGVDEAVVFPEAILPILKKKIDTPARHWTVIGEARKTYPELWAALSAKMRIEPPPFSDSVQGRWIAQLGWEGLQAGLGRKAIEVVPNYLRAPDAEIKLRKGLLPPGPTRG